MPDILTPSRFATRRGNRRGRLPANSLLIREGDTSDAVFRLVDGCVALSQMLPDGRRQIIDVLGPGRLFALPLDGPALCAAETLALSEVDRLELKTGSPDEMDRELRVMITRAQMHATLLGRKTAMEKVASAVLDLARQFARPSRHRRVARETFTLHLTRADLADWLGLTVETVSRCLNQMKRAGLLDFRPTEIVTLLDRPAIMVAAGLSPSRPASGRA